MRNRFRVKGDSNDIGRGAGAIVARHLNSIPFAESKVHEIIYVLMIILDNLPEESAEEVLNWIHDGNKYEKAS